MNDAAPGGFASAGYRKLYRFGGLCLGVIFAAVGILFLFGPMSVVLFFNNLAGRWGLGEAPLPGASLYLALAAAYMSVVTLLAFGMHNRPEERVYSTLLVQAKSASAVISVLLCFIAGLQLILVANAAVDGAIALAVALIAYRGRIRPR